MEKSLIEKLKIATSIEDEPSEEEIKYELSFLSQNNNLMGTLDLTNALANFYYENFKGYGTLGEATRSALDDLKRISKETDDLFETRAYGEEIGKTQKFFNDSIKQCTK